MIRRWKKVALAVGFLSLAGAALLAHASPATGYELSLYAATPVAVWGLLGIAYAVSLTLAVSNGGRIQRLALALGTAATVLVAGLVLVRDYRYFGAGDALTHLGWAKAIETGALDPVELLYPANHLIGVVLHAVAGGSVARNMLVVTVLFAFAYVVGTGLLVRRLTGSRWGLLTGVVSAWLFLPIINVSSYMMPYPTTQAIFFAPFVLFALVFFVQRGDRQPMGDGTTTSGTLLVLLGAALILVHPQQAVNILLVMVGVVGVQTAYRRYDPNHAIATHQYVLVPTGVLLGLLAVWLPIHQRSTAAADGVVSGTLDLLAGGADAAGTISQRGQSLTELGGSLLTVGLKLFGVSLVFLALSVLAVLTFWFYRDDRRDVGTFIQYLAASGLLIAVLFVFYFVSTPTISFRQVAFALVVVTVLGAVELSHLFERFRERFSAQTVTTAAVAVLAVFVVLSVITVFPSPYIYKPNPQVTTQQMDGHQSAFDYGVDDYGFSSIRTGPGRFAHGIYGLDDAVDLETPYHGSGIPEATFATGNYTETYDEPQYLVVSRVDYKQEVLLYEGFRYSEAGFERLSHASGVNKVMTNGGLDLYLVAGE